MTHEELMDFNEKVAQPCMEKLFENTVIPEKFCVIDNLKIAILNGRNSEIDSLIEASGLMYVDGKVCEYTYSETDISVEQFVKEHSKCALLLDGVLEVYEECNEFEIKTVISSMKMCAQIFPELAGLDAMDYIWQLSNRFVMYEKMRLLHEKKQIT